MSLQLANNWHFASLEVCTSSPMSGYGVAQDLEVALAEARSKISQLQELSLASPKAKARHFGLRFK